VTAARVSRSASGGAWAEVHKLPAFLSRDVQIEWSYRIPFLFDWLNLLAQVGIFYLVGQLVDSDKLPRFGGAQPSYVQFVAVGIAISSFVQIGLTRVVSALRNEQLMGTLESLLMTPTSPVTIQLGSVMYDLIYVPIRTAVFLTLVSLVLGERFTLGGIAPVAAILLVFIPLVWGIGMMSAAGVLVFKKGSGLVGFGAVVLSVGSTTYIPVEVFPEWLEPLVRVNPITLALDGTRNAMLGQAGWSEALPTIATLVPLMVASLAMGVASFSIALRRERRRGTLGLY